MEIDSVECFLQRGIYLYDLKKHLSISFILELLKKYVKSVSFKNIRTAFKRSIHIFIKVCQTCQKHKYRAVKIRNHCPVFMDIQCKMLSSMRMRPSLETLISLMISFNCALDNLRISVMFCMLRKTESTD